MVLAIGRTIIFLENVNLEDYMQTINISKTLLRRLPVYLDYLKSLPEEGDNISAATIARNLGLGHVLVRKDLAKVSVEGRCKTGRSKKQLIQDIEEHLEFCTVQMTQESAEIGNTKE